MICSSCAANVPSDAAYCPKCGAQIRGNIDPVQSPASATPELPADQLRNRSKQGAKADIAEKDLWQGGYSPKAMVGAWIGAGVLTVVGLVAAIFWLDSTGWLMFLAGLLLLWGYLGLTFAYRRYGVHYRLTSQRFIHERGILRRVTDRIEVIDIDDVRFEQGVIERFLNVGSINVTSSDRSTPELRLIGIDDVKAVADIIDKARRAERHRRGLYIESI
ncbi:MAG: PH domain-containing protein [Planctomycetota bacterium]|nr:PH domain-containing protein [Planctomycetota bacterium]